jgi:hypothetical protein
VNESALALGTAKHKAKTRQSTAPTVLNKLGIISPQLTWISAWGRRSAGNSKGSGHK